MIEENSKDNSNSCQTTYDSKDLFDNPHTLAFATRISPRTASLYKELSELFLSSRHQLGQLDFDTRGRSIFKSFSYSPVTSHGSVCNRATEPTSNCSITQHIIVLSAAKAKRREVSSATTVSIKIYTKITTFLLTKKSKGDVIVGSKMYWKEHLFAKATLILTTQPSLQKKMLKLTQNKCNLSFSCC